MIDTHVYCLPPALRRHDARLPASEINIQEAIYHHPEGPYALTMASPEAILASMDASGISISVLVAFPWNDSNLCRRNNDYILELAAADKRFMAICAVSPKTEGSLAEARRVLHSGALGIKVNPVWQNFNLTDTCMTALAKVIIRNAAFLMLHVDHPYKHSPASPAYLFDLASSQPFLKILATHLGGLLGLYALHEPVAAKLENIWFDTAVSATLDMVHWYCRAGLNDRIIFGTDFPFNHSHSQQQVLDGLLALKLPQDVMDNILKNNFIRLTGT